MKRFGPISCSICKGKFHNKRSCPKKQTESSVGEASNGSKTKVCLNNVTNHITLGVYFDHFITFPCMQLKYVNRKDHNLLQLGLMKDL